MGENEDPDVALREIFEKNGYVVSYEDLGARRTIFDNYDTLEHFRRVGRFRDTMIQLTRNSDDRVSDLVLNIEELHPYLFDILFAAVDALARAETTEQLAQASLSGRRNISPTLCIPLLNSHLSVEKELGMLERANTRTDFGRLLRRRWIALANSKIRGF